MSVEGPMVNRTQAIFFLLLYIDRVLSKEKKMYVEKEKKPYTLHGACRKYIYILYTCAREANI